MRGCEPAAAGREPPTTGARGRSRGTATFGCAWTLALRRSARRAQAREDLLSEPASIGADGARSVSTAHRLRGLWPSSDLLVRPRKLSPSSHGVMGFERRSKFRNDFAHGMTMMRPSGKRTLALCCDLINQLF